MTRRGQVHEAMHRHAKIVDVALVVVLLPVVFLAVPHQNDVSWAVGPQTGPVLALEALVFVALLLRRGRPVLALGVIVVAVTAVMLLRRGWSPIVIVSVVAVFTVASNRDRKTAAAAGLGAGICLVFGGSLPTGEWFTSASASTLAWTGFAAALGQAVKSQRASVAAVEERAVRAEQTREEEGRRRVIEERLRIARELHDVVAHHIAVIQVQSSVVDHLLTERPEAAREALGHVRRSSKLVLDELSDMLGVLRQPDDPITPTDPAPSLDRLPELIDTFTASGLRVDRRLAGPAVALPAAVDLVAYRLIQEGLTNAHKHGTGSAELVLDFEPDALMIDIRNRIAVPVVAGRSGSGPGHGLAGMRERAQAVGGTVSAAAEGDRAWRVTARVPVPAAAGTNPISSLFCRWGLGSPSGSGGDG